MKKQKLRKTPYDYFIALKKAHSRFDRSMNEMLRQPWRSFEFTFPEGIQYTIQTPFTEQEHKDQKKYRATICKYFLEQVTRHLLRPEKYDPSFLIKQMSYKRQEHIQLDPSLKVDLADCHSDIVDSTQMRYKELEIDPSWYEYETKRDSGFNLRKLELEDIEFVLRNIDTLSQDELEKWKIYFETIIENIQSNIDTNHDNQSYSDHYNTHLMAIKFIEERIHEFKQLEK